jgi:cell fate regulator YaaT (PSP1 superfamily)
MTDGINISDSRGEVLNMSYEKYCGCSKLSTFDWMKDIPTPEEFRDIVEVRFKNTRKGFYRNIHNIRFRAGDVIAVEASPGHDIGIVSLTGELVLRQMHKYGVRPDSEELKKAYRKAKPIDIDKWKEAIQMEHQTMIRSRQIAEDLKLDMKIGDVEYQGDKTKAIFYYIADERVDFRELIKVLADAFRIRIEMRQIGARQEAGRIGGIGSC